MSDYTCTLCGSKVSGQALSFIEDGRLYALVIKVCKDHKCLIKRGATVVDHRAERRLAG